MAPSESRREHTPAGCACLQKPRSDGVCALNVWQGTMIDAQAAQSEERLLRPHLPVVKYKEWTLCGLSGHLYHLVVLNWLQLLCLFVALYIAVVGLFALLFAACNGADLENRHGKVRYYFNLSLQTLSTIGFGYLYPTNSCSNWVSAAESFAAMVLVSFMTSVAFVKLAWPNPTIIFSKVFTVSECEKGGLEMRFRVVNGTRREVISNGEILDVSFKLILMRVEDTRNSEKKLCYYDLPLETSTFITLRLEDEIVHHINHKSPFFGQTQDDIQDSDFSLILMMTGVDQNLHDTIHERHEYDPESMRWAARFVAMMDWSSKRQCLDLDFAKVSAFLPQPLQRSYSSGAEIKDSPESGDESGEDEEESTASRGDQASEGGDGVPKSQTSMKVEIQSFTHESNSHEFPESKTDEPASKAQRRVRFKNHPLSKLFSKGLYYRALETSWARLLLWLVLVYFATIAITAALLYILPGTFVLETEKISQVSEYERLFFFCTQTIATIGYGVFSPNPDSNLVNFFVFVLVFAGAVFSTFLTGLAWAKFSIPMTSTVLFSDNLLLTAFHGHRALVFRAANNRTFGMLVDGSFRISFVMLNQRLERRDTHELKLMRNVWPIVQLGTTVTHIIDKHSPLYGFSVDELLSGHHFFAVLFTGLDSVVGETMFARRTYHKCDILVGHQFVDNIKLATNGIHADLEAINDIQFTSELELREAKLDTFLLQKDDPLQLPEEDGEESDHDRSDGRIEVDSLTTSYVQIVD
ncbi:Inward rectifier potassium channel 4 [Globisporangium polare]